MDNYKRSKIVTRMNSIHQQANIHKQGKIPPIPALIQGIAWWMAKLMPRPEQRAWGQGDTLVLGCDDNPFANAIGSPEFNYRPIGICKSLQAMWQNRHQVRYARSWSRFVYGTFPQNLNIDGPFKYVFVFPSYQWDDWIQWVGARLTDDAHVVVAQNMPFEHKGEGEHIYMKIKWNVCSVVESEEEAKAIIFKL